MKMEPIYINLILFSFIAVTIGIFVVDLNDVYQVGGNYTNTNDWAQFESAAGEMENHSRDIQNHTTGVLYKDFTDFTKYTDALMAFVDVGAILFAMPNTMFRYITYVDNVLGVYIPPMFLHAIYVVIVLIASFRVISIFVKPGDDV